MKNRLSKQQRESLNNKIVFVSVAMFLYAMLLVFVQKMSTDPITVNGALAFIDILRWVALIGAMGCAAWSAYKEKKSFFVYCAMCLFVFLSTTVIKFCTARNSGFAYLIVYAALVAMFILVQIYCALKIRGHLENEKIKAVFTTVCVIVAVAVAVISVVNINDVFLPDFMVMMKQKIFK